MPFFADRIAAVPVPPFLRLDEYGEPVDGGNYSIVSFRNTLSIHQSRIVDQWCETNFGPNTFWRGPGCWKYYFETEEYRNDFAAFWSFNLYALASDGYAYAFYPESDDFLARMAENEQEVEVVTAKGWCGLTEAQAISARMIEPESNLIYLGRLRTFSYSANHAIAILVDEIQ